MGQSAVNVGCVKRTMTLRCVSRTLPHTRLEADDAALIDFQRLFDLPAKDQRLAGKLLLRLERRLQAALGATGYVFQPRHEVVDDRDVADLLLAEVGEPQ